MTQIRPITILTVLAVAGGLAQTAAAQEPTTRPRQDIQGASPGFEERDKRVTAVLDVSANYRFRGDLSNGTGDVGILRTGMGLTVTAPVPPRNRLSVTFGSEQSWYDFSSSALLVAGDPRPWRHIQSYTLGVNFATQWSETLSSLLIGNVNFAGEGSAAFEDGFTGGGGAAMILKLSEGLDLTGGVFVRSRLGGGVYVFPIVGIEWQINKQWRLSNENQPGLYLSYAIDEKWRLSFGARYDFSEFRLENNGVVPNGIGSDERVPVTFGVDWTPTPNVTVQARVGAVVYEKLKLRNSQRDTLGDTTVDPGLYLSGGLVLRF
ncbi:MAG: TonB-dependent receptor [Phycisphaeraceae bacterium]|nr:TonB-dependent receptor [Phycisphaeraceae bacterium]